jgi:2-keto-4-pentenoate hydratase/2-oxohepta-3-ene-1,7-dioic acid hydratase in catechol pathway
MRFASFEYAGRSTYGALVENRLIDLNAVRDWPYPDLRSLLAAWSPQLPGRIARLSEPGIALAAIRWLPLIPNPAKIVCVGLNYRDHLAETNRAAPTYPVLFLRLPGSQIGHLQALIRPSVSAQLDFEGELAVIIGRPGRHIALDSALHHVAGYSIYNEASIRDWQHHSHQYTAGKNFTATGAFGPWLVTADEIPDPRTLRLITRLNGTIMQQASVSDLIFPIEYLIAYVSQMIELEAGDVIVTGTPAGVGGLRRPPVWMQPGDMVEVEVSDVGVLSNPVQQEELPL